MSNEDLKIKLMKKQKIFDSEKYIEELLEKNKVLSEQLGKIVTLLGNDKSTPPEIYEKVMRIVSNMEGDEMFRFEMTDEEKKTADDDRWRKQSINRFGGVI